jgi:hypothetical protein
MGGLRRAFLPAVCLVICLMGAITRVVSQQKAGAASVQTSAMPSVLEQPNRLPVLQLSAPQRKAVDGFLRSHRGFTQAGFQTLQLNDPDARQLYEEWRQTALHYLRKEGATVQYPFAAWGDLKGDGRLDFILPFFSGQRVNLGGRREWLFVVFEPHRDGTYTPAVAARDSFGLCLDGMLFRPSLHRVAYWCKTSEGQFQWNGAQYEYERLK